MESALAIDQLLAAQPYHPDTIPDLEAFVDEQIARGLYHLDANLALLRLYQFVPERVNRQKITKILVKAMMALPRVDFSLCLCLLPESIQMETDIVRLATLANLLECAQFSEFWTMASQEKDLLGNVPGFDDAIRLYALHVLGLSYRRVPREVLAEAVNVNGPSLDDFIQRGVETKGWFVSKTANGEVIELGSGGSTTWLHKGTIETIPADHVARLFPMLA